MDLLMNDFMKYREYDGLSLTSCFCLCAYFNMIWVDESDDSDEGYCIWARYDDNGTCISFGDDRVF